LYLNTLYFNFDHQNSTSGTTRFGVSTKHQFEIHLLKQHKLQHI